MVMVPVSIRIPEDLKTAIARICERDHRHEPDAYREALANWVMDRVEARHLVDSREEYIPGLRSTNRVDQVGYVRQVAADLTSTDTPGYDGDVEMYVESMIELWLDHNVEDLPDWWDEHDTELLGRFMREELGE